MTTDEKPRNPLTTVGGIVGAIVGFYCGFMLLIPSVVAVVAFMAVKKVELPRLESFKLGVAVLLGHTAWIAIAFFAPHARAVMVLPDIVLALAGIVWLCAKPGLPPVCYLIGFEALGLIVNLNSIGGQHFGRPQHKALVTHIALRLFIAVSLWLGWKQTSLKKPTLTPPPFPAIPPLPDGTSTI